MSELIERAGAQLADAAVDHITVTVIRTVEELRSFTLRFRQDWFSQDALTEKKLFSECELWIHLPQSHTFETFYVVEDEADDFSRNDGWGAYSIFRAGVARTPDETIHVLKERIDVFPH